MANLTITIDDHLLRKARIRAAEIGTSVNAVLREYLRSWVGERSTQAEAAASFLRRARRARSGSGGIKVTRDELHER